MARPDLAHHLRNHNHQEPWHCNARLTHSCKGGKTTLSVGGFSHLRFSTTICLEENYLPSLISLAYRRPEPTCLKQIGATDFSSYFKIMTMHAPRSDEWITGYTTVALCKKCLLQAFKTTSRWSPGLELRKYH